MARAPVSGWPFAFSGLKRKRQYSHPAVGDRNRYPCATHSIHPSTKVAGATRHREFVMEARQQPTKESHQALIRFPTEGQPSPAVHKKKWSTIMCDYSLHHVATRPA